eukprot:UN21827
MELNGFPNSHHKLYVRINMKESKLLTSNFMQRIIVKESNIFNALKCLVAYTGSDFETKKLVASTRSHVTWYFEESELASIFENDNFMRTLEFVSHHFCPSGFQKQEHVLLMETTSHKKIMTHKLN